MAVAALAGLLSAEPASMYLPPTETGGAEFQFNPASPDLGAAVKAREPRPDSLLDARALAEDLVFLAGERSASSTAATPSFCRNRTSTSRRCSISTSPACAPPQPG